MSDQKGFGITVSKRIDATTIHAKKIEYPTTHYILLGNEKVTLDNLSNRLLVNPTKYLKELEERIEAMDKYAKIRDLRKLMITLTASNQKENPSDNDILQVLDQLNKSFRQIRQLKSWVNIQKDIRLYIKVVEPHKSGNPHFHILLWIPVDAMEAFVSALFKKFQKPQIDVSSDYIPPHLESKKLIRKSDKNMISYTLIRVF